MQRLSRDSLPLGGFAGLREHRLVTDRRIFSRQESSATADGLGNFVYLADAQFNPLGETGMHPHKEIDVISVMIDGRVNHAGSLEHGKRLEAGDVQVQRAGGEGFSHNEINPDETKNRMIQLWVLPEEKSQAAGYKYYTPKPVGLTRIYGGDRTQSETFDSSTKIDILRLEANTSIKPPSESLSYVTSGQAHFIEGNESLSVKDGDLVRGNDIEVKAKTNTQIIVVR